ncbi:hypothetical protein VKT23_007677 [Stygiomarasmius scandens]|uniref:Uncharacterized protein n=1 Tax=Marasmiellus scandens TaxID=2682957 RepID=A0ABR1JKF8_9AGAR
MIPTVPNQLPSDTGMERPSAPVPPADFSTSDNESAVEPSKKTSPSLEDNGPKRVFASALCADKTVFDKWRRKVPVYYQTDPEFQEVFPKSDTCPETAVNLSLFWQAVDDLMDRELAQAEGRLSKKEKDELQEFLAQQRESVENQNPVRDEGQDQAQNEDRDEDQGQQGFDLFGQDILSFVDQEEQTEKQRAAAVLERKAEKEKENQEKLWKSAFLPLKTKINEAIYRLWYEKYLAERDGELYSDPNGFVPASDPTTMIQLAEAFHAAIEPCDTPYSNEAAWGASLKQLLKHVWTSQPMTAPLRPEETIILPECDILLVAERGDLDVHPGDICRTDLLAFSTLKDLQLPDKLGLLKWFRLQEEFALAIFAAIWKKADLLSAKRQLILALTPAAACNEILGLDKPVFGFVITLSGTFIYACKAHKRSDGTLSYGFYEYFVLKSLNRIQDFARFYGFISAHKRWYIREVYRPLALVLRRTPSVDALVKRKTDGFEPWRRSDIKTPKRKANKAPPGEKDAKQPCRTICVENELYGSDLLHGVDTMAVDPADGQYKQARYFHGRLVIGHSVLGDILDDEVLEEHERERLLT